MLLLAIFLVLFFTVVPLFFTTFFQARIWPRPVERARPRVPGAADLRLHVRPDVAVVGRGSLRVAKN